MQFRPGLFGNSISGRIFTPSFFTGACAACSHCSATAWELSDLDHSHAATPQASVCHARFRCSAPAFCAWRRPPLICLKLLVGVYVRDGLAASVCVYRTCAASVELLPRGWRALDFPRWLHDQSCLTWATRLIVILIVRCCFGGSCARDELATCLCMSLLPLSLFLGVLAPSLSFGRFMNSKPLDVARRDCSFSHQLAYSSCVFDSFSLALII